MFGEEEVGCPVISVYITHRIIDGRIYFSKNYRWQNGKVRFLICLHLKVALLRCIEESSCGQEGRMISRQQIV